MDPKQQNYETIFPFEEGKEYLDRGIFPFTAARINPPLDFSTFDSLHLIPFEVIPSDGKKKEERIVYFSASLGRNRYRKETKINLYLSHGLQVKDREKQNRLYNIFSLFWKKGDAHENTEGQRLRDDIIAFCQKENLSVCEYISTDPSRSVPV